MMLFEPRSRFTACLERFALAHEISDFYSTAVGRKSLAKCYSINYVPMHRTTRFTSFPDYLMIQMVKFTFAEDWVPKKIGRSTYTRVIQ